MNYHLQTDHYGMYQAVVKLYCDDLLSVGDEDELSVAELHISCFVDERNLVVLPLPSQRPSPAQTLTDPPSSDPILCFQNVYLQLVGLSLGPSMFCLTMPQSTQQIDLVI